MTIDDQLRDIARRLGQHQQVITAEEIVQRASSRRTGSLRRRYRFNDRRHVLNHRPVQFSEEEVTMLDLETPTATAEQRKAPNVVRLAVLLAAAAVIAIALVAIRNDDPVTPADQPSPTVTVPPRALFGTPGAQLTPGTYYVDTVDGSPTPRILITIGDGWTNTQANWGILKVGAGFISFSRPDRVWADACQAGDGFYEGRLDTLDGMVAALHAQDGWLNVTPPSDASVDGYAGKTFQRTAPADFTGCNPGYAEFRGWDCCGQTGPGAQIYYEPNEIETVRVVDLDGTIIVVSGKLKPDHQEPAAAAELAATIDSIRIEPA